MLKLRITIAMIGFVAIAAALPARAQAPQAPAVSLEQVTKMARDNGMVLIRQIELDDGKWEVEGRDRTGERRELHFDATSGKLLRNERD
ncbi:MAG: PepSY domain-containing protein [Pseudorhodoplanes sp.]|uniref:PepSY domain-containing protein n=1 Tax=Pseudorhodoplanes sp. TaxID=1934341 RepID=UPI003D110D87